LISLLDRIGIAIVRRVRILERAGVDSPRVLGLSTLSCSSIGLISLYSRAVETARTYSTRYLIVRYLIVRLRLVSYLAFTVPITIAIPLIVYSPVVVFIPYIFLYYLMPSRGLLRS